MFNDMMWTLTIGILLAVFGFAGFLSGTLFTYMRKKRCSLEKVGKVVELKMEIVHINDVDESQTGEYVRYSPVYEVMINNIPYKYDDIGLFDEDEKPDIGSKCTFYINPDDFYDYYAQGELRNTSFCIIGLLFMAVGIVMGICAYSQI